MVDVKISQLPAAGAITGTDRLELSQAGVSKQGTVTQFATALGTPSMLLGKEGLFVPTVSCATPGDLSVFYTSQIGAYTRVGQMVLFRIGLAFTPTFTLASGEIRIAGLPYAAFSDNDGGWLTDNNAALSYPAGTLDARAVSVSGQSYLRLTGLRTAATPTLFTMANLTTALATAVSAMGFYRSTVPLAALAEADAANSLSDITVRP